VNSPIKKTEGRMNSKTKRFKEGGGTLQCMSSAIEGSREGRSRIPIRAQQDLEKKVGTVHENKIRMGSKKIQQAVPKKRI